MPGTGIETAYQKLFKKKNHPNKIVGVVFDLKEPNIFRGLVNW
jgi:hypothetical protein